jgi:hypothetical protein
MTKEERDELRKKHVPLWGEDLDKCRDCGQPWEGGIPCDAIRALDWAETVSGNILDIRDAAQARLEKLEVSNCDHWVGVKKSGKYRYADTPKGLWEFTYCPKCGAKL